MNTFDFARRYLYPYKVKGDEIVPKYCPFCRGGSHHDQETFALNTIKQTYNCKRGTCGKQGHFTQLCKEYGEQADMDNYEVYKQPKTYKKPQTKVNPITNQAEQYLALRKISKHTMDHYGVGCDEKGNIVFPFTENGELVFVKFRPAKKVEKGERKAWREEGGKPILFGMDKCVDDYPLVITEGEIDAMSLHEAGIKNAVSVPSGAEDLTWLDTCWDFLQQFKKIVLFGDMDEPGKEMVRKLILKFGSYRCYTVEHKYKDANELLYKEGKESVEKVYDNAKPVPIVGLIQLSDVKPLDIKNIQRVPTGIPALDREIGGSVYGDLTILTGKPGEGKSTVAGIFMLEGVEKRVPVCAYSGELRKENFQYWINLQAAGKWNVDKYYDSMRGKEVSYVKPENQEKIKEWYREKFFLYDNEIAYREKSEETSILKIFEYAANRYEAKLFLVDNLMSARKEYDSESDFYKAQGNFVGKLKAFANAYNVHVILVAHPRKTNNTKDIEGDDISGSAEIIGRADNAYCIMRVKDQEYGTLLRVKKNRGDGADIDIALDYCKESRRLYQHSIGDVKRYGWEGIKSENKEVYTECPF